MEQKDQKEQPKQKEQTQHYFFPNPTKGLPFSCEATSESEAIKANQEYLKQQKETN